MSLFRGLRWNDTATIYHRETSKNDAGKTVTTWTGIIAENCFFGLSKRQTVSNTVLSEHDRHICRIPSESMSTAPEKGDVICKGIVSVTIPDNGSPEKHLVGVEHFTADVVSDNRQLPNTAHWYVAEV